MMLASTVQFSRYGRSRSCLVIRREDPGPCRGMPYGRSLRTQQRARPVRHADWLSVPKCLATQRPY